jgi:peptidoglycan/xylan/chitin deacetylase (PgdA/CDA1 family)
MICLTGDVHQEFNTEEQTHYAGTEFKAALEYAEIAQSYDIDLTLFLTGKVVKANADQVRVLSGNKKVEIGGHTWSAFRPSWLHKAFSWAMDSVYGPKYFQKLDIERTLSTIEKRLDESVRSWRTHAYNSDRYTYEVLSETSVTFISDQKSTDTITPIEYNAYSLIECPINVITDHEHIIHAGRTKQSVRQLQEEGWSDEFGSASYSIEQWSEQVIEQIDRIEQADGLATILIHPGCMKAADEFKTFDRICSYIAASGYKTQTIREISRH